MFEDSYLGQYQDALMEDYYREDSSFDSDYWPEPGELCETCLDDLSNCDCPEESRCVICVEYIQFCIGHPAGLRDKVWEAHDNGDHSMCHPQANECD